MAVEGRSESILLTGSSEGEVRVWSLRKHPVARVSGFRCGDTGVSGGGGRKSRVSKQSRAVTQLGLFEGRAWGAALDVVVRVWDVER